jgi:hypothetical protein
VSGRPTAEWRAQTPRRFGNFLWALSSSVADIVGTGRTGDRTAFFGMANDTVASIEVIWPGGARQLVRDIYCDEDCADREKLSLFPTASSSHSFHFSSES